MYHRLMPEDAYLPYDPTRSGAVTGPVFRRGLSDAFRMTFTDAKLDALAQRYRQSENKVSQKTPSREYRGKNRGDEGCSYETLGGPRRRTLVGCPPTYDC